MIRLEMTSCNMISAKKLQKYKHYHQVKFINLNILQVKKLLPSNQSIIIEQATFPYSPLGKALKKQTKII